MDWKILYQARTWAENVLASGAFDELEDHVEDFDERSAWKLSRTEFFEVLLEMMLENGMIFLCGSLIAFIDSRNENLLHPSQLVGRFRVQKECSQLCAMLTLFLSPIALFDPELSRPSFSAAQRAVYVPAVYPLQTSPNTPNFVLLLSILKFFQHHLNYVSRQHGRHIVEPLRWRHGDTKFQPGPRVTKHDFMNDPRKLEGTWVGLYCYLGWTDFEAIRDSDPLTLEAHQQHPLRDYIGGPQTLTIRFPEKNLSDSNDDSSHSISVTGEGVHGGPFTFNGRVRKVRIPAGLFGREMDLWWQITFVKIYANGENSWTRWIYDGFYCPGKKL
jgi:hypothetical protein